MTVTYEEKNKNEGTLHFTVSQEEAQKALKRAYKRVKNSVSVPGFRKGKISYNVFVKMFGEQALYEDAINFVLPTAFPEAIKESELDEDKLVGRPQFDIEQVEPGKDWKLLAHVALKPEVTLGEYKGLEVPKQDRDVAEEDVEKRIEDAQSNLAELAVKEGAAAEGDTVVIDFVGYKDGEAFDNGSAENFSLELGSGSFVPGFEEQLVGASEGDEKTLDVTFPEDYQAEDLAGQAVEFKVTVHEVKEKITPELDDEFAKDVDEEVETLDELREKYRKEIAERKEAAAKEAVEEAAIRKAIDNAEFGDVPQAMIDEEIDRQVDHYLNEMQRQGISEEMFFNITGSSREKLREEFSEDADVRVKTDLLLEAIREAEDLDATEEEIQSEIDDLAKAYDMEAEQVSKVVTEDMLKHDISLKKAMAIITDSAVEAD
ncbi:trigger factor [Aerococcus vaginalis]